MLLQIIKLVFLKDEESGHKHDPRVSCRRTSLNRQQVFLYFFLFYLFIYLFTSNIIYKKAPLAAAASRVQLGSSCCSAHSLALRPSQDHQGEFLPLQILGERWALCFLSPPNRLLPDPFSAAAVARRAGSRRVQWRRMIRLFLLSGCMST